MFDVSFSELVVIAIVALIVIGPEKLPKVARTLGALMGRMQRYVAQIKEEVNREVRFEELQQLQSEIEESVAKTKEIVHSNLINTFDSLTQNTEELKLELENAIISNELATTNQLSTVDPSKDKSKIKKVIIKKVAAKKLPTVEAEAKNVTVKKINVRKTAAKKSLTEE